MPFAIEAIHMRQTLNICSISYAKLEQNLLCERKYWMCHLRNTQTMINARYVKYAKWLTLNYCAICCTFSKPVIDIQPFETDMTIEHDYLVLFCTTWDHSFHHFNKFVYNPLGWIDLRTCKERLWRLKKCVFFFE